MTPKQKRILRILLFTGIFIWVVIAVFVFIDYQRGLEAWETSPLRMQMLASNLTLGCVERNANYEDCTQWAQDSVDFFTSDVLYCERTVGTEENRDLFDCVFDERQ